MRILLLLLVLPAVLGQKEDLPEDINLEGFFANEQKSEEFFDCMLDVKECSDELKMWKEILPTVFASECGECSDVHKALFLKANELMREKYPGRYEELVKKMKEQAL